MQAGEEECCDQKMVGDDRFEEVNKLFRFRFFETFGNILKYGWQQEV